MPPAEPHFLTVGHGADCRRIATILTPAAATAPRRAGVMWLPGFKSEMTSTKASALAAWAEERGAALTRLDYSGHGQSEGRVEDGSIGRWLEEVVHVFTTCTAGPQVVVGSSMGGYLALLLVRHLQQKCPDHAARIKALILIAPAWDMTELLMWGRFPESIKKEILAAGVYLRPSKYGDGPYPITRHLIEEGRSHLIGSSTFDPGRPIHVLHGLLDPDVPWEHTLDLVAHCEGDWVEVTAVPDGDHRLSRSEDIEQLLALVDRFSVL